MNEMAPYKFKAGQSGNPAGRPKGCRNRLSRDFIKALEKDFRKHGAAAIIDVRETRPADYLKIIAMIIPKDINIGGQEGNPVNVNISIDGQPIVSQ